MENIILRGTPTETECWNAWVNGEALPLYITTVTHERAWEREPVEISHSPVGIFELEAGKTAEISISYAVDVNSAVVRPLALGITPVVENNTVRFTIPGTGSYTVEINGSFMGAAHIFAAPVMERPAEGENVIILEKGVHTRNIEMTTGQILYLAPGSILRGKIVGKNAQNLKIYGSGVIEGSIFDRWKDVVVPIDLMHCDNFEIRGITILDPAAWTLNLYHSTHGLVEDVHIVGARSNSDGFTLQSCEDILVKNCFARCWDDCLVVKDYEGDTRRLTFDNCILWTDLAQSCEVGYETRGEIIEDVTFQNITVLHNFHKPTMSIHNSDRASIRNITFRNVVIEDLEMGEGDGVNHLLELTTTPSQWSRDKVRGNISNVLAENITVLSGKESSIRVFANDAESPIDHVAVRNLTMFGKQIRSFDEIGLVTSEFTGKDITIE